MDEDDHDLDRTPIPRLKRPRASIQCSDEDSYARGRDIETHDDGVRDNNPEDEYRSDDDVHSGEIVGVGVGDESERNEGSGGAHVPLRNKQHNAADRSPQASVGSDGWCQLYTSAQSLTMMLEALGVRGIRVEQWYNLNTHAHDENIMALVMLYKWRVDRDGTKRWNFVNNTSVYKDETSAPCPTDVLFVNQMLSVGSATQAIIAALMNAPLGTGTGIDIGDSLEALRKFISPMTPVLRSVAICNSKKVRDAHNFAAKEYVSLFRNPPEVELADDFWMYSIFVPGKSGRSIYELDGFGLEPRILGSLSQNHDDEFLHDLSNEWLAIAAGPIEEQIEELRRHSVPFQVYALVQNKAQENGVKLSEKIVANSSRNNLANSCPPVSGGNGKSQSEQDGTSTPSTSDLENCGKLLNGHRQGYSKQFKLSQKAYLREDQENRIATHNYDTFFIEMMKLLASKGDLNRLRDNMGDDEYGDVSSSSG